MVQEGELALSSFEPALTNDSIAETDSIISEPEPVYGILLTPPKPEPAAPLRSKGNDGVSFILCGVFILFLIIALRFRNNIKYAVTMFRNLVETRTRQNVFDDTVRETSLIVLLNILWCACVGIIGYCVFQFTYPEEASFDSRAVGMLLGMGVAAVYTLFMWLAYSCVGWVFSDKSHAELWVKGFSACQAIMTPAFFLFALLGISRPDLSLVAGFIAVGVFILAKMVFIWKGYRIFFNQFSSWVLFLCYLCSLEIVPLILCYRSAIFLGKIL